MNTKPLLALLLIGFLGAVSPLQAQTARTWDGGSTVDDNWSSIANWNPDGSPSGNPLYFGNTGKTAQGVVSSYVDQSYTIESLAFTNYGATTSDWQTLQINSGVTLTIDATTAPSDSNLLRVGAVLTSARTTSVAIQGQGSLVVSDSAYNIWVNNTANTTGGIAVLDMSGLNSFSATVNQFAVGAAVPGATPGASPWGGQGVVNLAKTNSVTANSMIVGSSESTLAGSGVAASQLNLGQTNVLNVSSIYVGAGSGSYGSRSSGTMQFQTPSGSDTPSVVIRGTAGGTSRASLMIGGGNAYIGGAVTTSTVDFTGGTVDALFDSLIIVKAYAGNNVTGSLKMDEGTIDATTVYVGWSTGSGNNTQQLNASLDVSGGTFTAGTVTMSWQDYTATQYANSFLNVSGTGKVDVTGNITVGYAGNKDSNVYATINISGGELKVGGNIAKGVSSYQSRVNSTITLNGGILDMTEGTISDLTTFNVQSGTLKNLAQFNSGANITKTTSGTLIIDGTNAYTGDTLVNEGTVRVNGSTTASTNDFTVANAATLGGAGGSIAGTVTIQAGGTLDPGASASSTGLLTTGSLALQSSSAVKMQINGATAGTGYDQVTINGTVNLGSAADLQLTLGYGALTIGQTFAILLNDGTDAITGAFATINGAAFGADNTFDLAYNSAIYSFKLYYTGNGTSTTGGNDAVLEVTAVPEPSTIALLLSALLSIVMIARRRRQFAQEKI